MTKARDLADLGGVTTRLEQVGNTDGALSNRSLIINGGMTVSQRGDYTTATAVTNNHYSVDRWKDWSSSVTTTHQNTSVTIDGKTYKALRVSATSSSSTANIGARQYVEGINLIPNETYTVHCYMRTNNSNARLRTYDMLSSGPSQTATIPADEQWHKVEVTVDYTSTINPQVGAIIYGNEVTVPISSGDYIEYTLFQLEAGDTATPFENRSYGDELARCQRYYQKGFSIYNEDGSNGFVSMLPVEMRASPSATRTASAISSGESTPSQVTPNNKRIYIYSGSLPTGGIYDLDAEL